MQAGSETLLREGLQEGADFAIVSEATWELLHGWYGGGPLIRRPTVREGVVTTEIQLELTLLHLLVHLETDDVAAKARAATPLSLHISRGASVTQALEQICATWQLDAAKARALLCGSNPRLPCL